MVILPDDFEASLGEDQLPLSGEANSVITAGGYTGSYAFANVILTVAGTIAMLL
jgi:hypothetical protein